MKMAHGIRAIALLAFAAPAVSAQPELPKPGPEHDVFKAFVGTWDTTVKFPSGESKGTTTYKMDLGGWWLSSTLETDLGGVKFQGKGMDSYSAAKKKYVSVWFDSLGTQPMVMEGTFDKDKKTMTLTGEAAGADGKLKKWKSVTTISDADTIHFGMFVGDAKEPVFTIVYKRKK